jgi:hypothetical protein
MDSYYLLAATGGIPRLASLCGHINASELLLTGKCVVLAVLLPSYALGRHRKMTRLTVSLGHFIRIISAQEARDRFSFVNQVVGMFRSPPLLPSSAAYDNARSGGGGGVGTCSFVFLTTWVGK